MIYSPAIGRRDDSVRLSVARTLGHAVDGAWWPRVDRITIELPRVVAALTPLLGRVTAIDVNWPPLQRPPNLNLPGWKGRSQHVMTVSGEDASAKLLIIPYATRAALALMVLRLAAKLHIDPADRETPAFLAAGSIVLAAQQQCTPIQADCYRRK